MLILIDYSFDTAASPSYVHLEKLISEQALECFQLADIASPALKTNAIPKHCLIATIENENFWPTVVAAYEEQQHENNTPLELIKTQPSSQATLDPNCNYTLGVMYVVYPDIFEQYLEGQAELYQGSGIRSVVRGYAADYRGQIQHKKLRILLLESPTQENINALLDSPTQYRKRILRASSTLDCSLLSFIEPKS